MSDITTVLETIAQNIVSAIYPNGTSQPSVTGERVIVGTADPVRSNLDESLKLNRSHVGVFSANMNRVVTKFERVYRPLTKADATIILTVSDDTVTVSGTVEVPQSVMIIVDGVGYGYSVEGEDTLATIAANTAALIPDAGAVGAVITIENAREIIARVSTEYTAIEELGRIESVVDIKCYCPNPTARRVLASAINNYMLQSYRMPMPDGYFAMISWKGDSIDDSFEKSRLYMQKLSYIVQYATTLATGFMSITNPYVRSTTFNT